MNRIYWKFVTNIPAMKRKLTSLENGQFSSTVTWTHKKMDWEWNLGQFGLEKGFMPRFQNNKASLTDMMHGNPKLRAPKYSILNTRWVILQTVNH